MNFAIVCLEKISRKTHCDFILTAFLFGSLTGFGIGAGIGYGIGVSIGYNVPVNTVCEIVASR